MSRVVGYNPGNIVLCLFGDEFCIAARCTFDNMHIRRDDAFTNKEATAERDWSAPCVLQHQNYNRAECILSYLTSTLWPCC